MPNDVAGHKRPGNPENWVPVLLLLAAALSLTVAFCGAGEGWW